MRKRKSRPASRGATGLVKGSCGWEKRPKGRRRRKKERKIRWEGTKRYNGKRWEEFVLGVWEKSSEALLMRVLWNSWCGTHLIVSIVRI